MRKQFIAAALLLAAAFVLRAADPAHFKPAQSATTTVAIKGTSSLHEWEMKGSTIEGSIETDPDAWSTSGEKPAAVRVSIPVASIRSAHERMDRIMREALKAEANPNITYTIASASLVSRSADAFVARTTGKLTIAGMTRDVAFDVTVRRSADGTYDVAADVPMKMTDFGVKPPVAMMGTLKTGNDITVSFHWIVKRS